MTRTKTRANANTPNNYVSVLDYGADPTGATDSREVIQSAIDSLQEYDELFIPAGSYLFNSKGPVDAETYKNRTTTRCLKINTDNIKITCARGARFLIDNSVDWIHTDGTNNATIIVYSEGTTGVEISGLDITSLDGNRSTGENTVGIEFNRCTRAILSDLDIGYIGAGVRFSESSFCDVRDSYLHHCYDTAANIFGGCTYTTITNCEVTTSGDGNCTMYGNNEHCEIRGCKVSGDEVAGTQVIVCESSHFCTVRDCIVDGSNGHVNNGIIVNRSRFCNVRGNDISGVNYGIVIRDTDLEGAGGVPNWNTIISDNSIYEIQERINDKHPLGIWVQYSSNVLITNNQFGRFIGSNQLDEALRVPKYIYIRTGQNTPDGAQNQNISVCNNTFMMKHQEVGFGFYSNPHFIVYSQQEIVNGFTFKNNTIVCTDDNQLNFGLLKFNDVRNITISGNQLNANNLTRGPVNLLEVVKMRGLVFTGNNLNFGRNTSGNTYMIRADESWGAVITNNVLGGQNQPVVGYLMRMTDKWQNTIFSNNYVAGCSRVASSNSQPVNFTFTNNIVNYDFAGAFDGVTPDIDTDNILINY